MRQQALMDHAAVSRGGPMARRVLPLAVAVGVAAAEERVGVGVPATEGDGTGCAEAGPPRANQASPRITSPATTPKAAPSHALPRGCTGLE